VKIYNQEFEEKLEELKKEGKNVENIQPEEIFEECDAEIFIGLSKFNHLYSQGKQILEEYLMNLQKEIMPESQGDNIHHAILQVIGQF